MNTIQDSINRLRTYASAPNIDEKHAMDINNVCNEVIRLREELSRANNLMDDDHITIEKYKKKLERCNNRLVKYEPF